MYLHVKIRACKLGSENTSWIRKYKYAEMDRKTRCRPSKGRRCIPDVVIWVHVETYLNDFSSLAQVKIQFRIKKKTSQNSISIFFLNQIIMFPCSSTLKDLSIDVSNTNVGLILTKLRRFQLFVKI